MKPIKCSVRIIPIISGLWKKQESALWISLAGAMTKWRRGHHLPCLCRRMPDYKKNTTFPDIINISIQVLELSAAKLTLGYTMRVSDDIVCTASSKHCFLNEAGRPISIKKQYPDFYRLLASLKAEADAGKAGID